MPSNRLDYIDVAKGIGILLVVWAHILVVGPSHQLIYAFHMPLFFFVSGLLFNSGKYPSFVSFVKIRAKRLLLPYVIYSIVTWMIWAGFRYLRGDAVDSYWMPLLQTFIAQGSGAYIVHNSALWFIPCLFAVEVLYYFVRKAKGFFPLLICIIIAGINSLLIRRFGKNYLFMLPWNLDAAFYALPFYSVANLIRNKVGLLEIQEKVSDNKCLTFFCLAVLSVALCFLSFNYGECSMGSSSYMCPDYVFFARAFVGIAALMMISLLICSFDLQWVISPMAWCGENSLDIMCLHIPIKGVVIILICKLMHPLVDVSSSSLYSALAFAITMGAIVPLVLCINKFIRK